MMLPSRNAFIGVPVTFEMPGESIWEQFKRPWVEFGLQLKHSQSQRN
jgi:hypothetical protein